MMANSNVSIKCMNLSIIVDLGTSYTNAGLRIAASLRRENIWLLIAVEDSEKESNYCDYYRIWLLHRYIITICF